VKQNRELPVLHGDRVSVRMGEYEDIPSIIKFYTDNKVHLAPFEPKRSPKFYSEYFWQNELINRKNDFLADNSLKMFVFSNSTSEVIGVINFNQIIKGAFFATYLGYSLDENMQGKGYMSESLQLAIDYVFNYLKLHRIMANYMPTNQKSAGVLKGLGFTVEGYARDYLLINGRWEDHILTSLTNQQWEMS